MKILRNIIVVFLALETISLFNSIGLEGLFLGLQFIAMIFYILRTTRHLNKKSKRNTGEVLDLTQNNNFEYNNNKDNELIKHNKIKIDSDNKEIEKININFEFMITEKNSKKTNIMELLKNYDKTVTTKWMGIDDDQIYNNEIYHNVKLYENASQTLYPTIRFKNINNNLFKVFLDNNFVGNFENIYVPNNYLVNNTFSSKVIISGGRYKIYQNNQINLKYEPLSLLISVKGN